MNNIQLNIKSNDEIFYKQLLHLLRSFSPIKNLTDTEINVLAEIMKRNAEYEPYIKEEHLRRNLIFNKESREEMCTKLGMSRDNFNNYLSFLRKKKILDSNNMINKTLNIFPDGKFEFKVTFNL